VTVSLATETANQVWAGPNTGAAAAPAFRALVNADLPLSGVGAGTYAKVTVNTAGVVTSASAQASLTADVSGILPYVNGGTGSGTAANHATMISSGSAWTYPVVPDCPTGGLQFTQASNSYGCGALAAHALLSATHSDTVAGGAVRGGLIVANSTPAWAQVSLGAAGTVVTSNGTDLIESTTITSGTITASAPLQVTQTWNSGGTTFTAARVNVTDTASNAASLLFDLQKATVSQWKLDKSGNERLIGTGSFGWTGSIVASTTGANTLLLTNNAAAQTLNIVVAGVTINSGFGTGPSIAGNSVVGRVTIGTPTGTSGIVQFGTAFANAPACWAFDETTTAANPVKPTATTSQVTLASAGFVAADSVVFGCLGY
jgi:hypothetical protein